MVPVPFDPQSKNGGRPFEDDTDRSKIRVRPQSVQADLAPEPSTEGTCNTLHLLFDLLNPKPGLRW